MVKQCKPILWYLFVTNGLSMLLKSQVKYIQSLGHKKFRDTEQVFVAEGPKLTGELLQAKNIQPLQVYALQEWVDKNLAAVERKDVFELHIVREQELSRISFLTKPNQVLGLFKKPSFPPIQLEHRISLALDGIQDPGNLGTLVRIADWFAIEQIICSEETADLFNPKVVQSSMGSLARVQVLHKDLKRFFSEHAKPPVYGMLLQGTALQSMGKIEEGIILVGNESKGISEELLPFVKHRVTIPRLGHAESLNAAVATGIVLSHIIST